MLAVHANCHECSALLLRKCRREDDGSYVVLMHSVEHPAVPHTEPAFFQWTAPIRANVSWP
jgi:hypothetical protein